MASTKRPRQASMGLTPRAGGAGSAGDSGDRLPRAGDSRQAIHQNLYRNGYTTKQIEALDEEAKKAARAHSYLEPNTTLMLVDADNEVAAAMATGRHQSPDWNPDRPLSLRESAAMDAIARSYLGGVVERTRHREYTINLKPVANREERFRRRMALIEALAEEGLESTGEGCAYGATGENLGCDISIETNRDPVDVEEVARRLAPLFELAVDDVRMAGSMPARAAQHDCYGPEHRMGAIVPKGGSMCGNCAFGHSEKDGPHCLNKCWSETPVARGGGGGKTHLPVMDATTYCCDMWAPVPPKKKA